MVEEQYNYQDQFLEEVSLKLRDLETKQRISTDRLLLIGENLVELREKVIQENLELKKTITIMQQQIKKLVSFLETASTEMTKFAKKEDVNLIYKQVKMFQEIIK